MSMHTFFAFGDFLPLLSCVSIIIHDAVMVGADSDYHEETLNTQSTFRASM